VWQFSDAEESLSHNPVQIIIIASMVEKSPSSMPPLKGLTTLETESQTLANFNS